VLRRVLKREKLVAAEESVRVERSASDGHVAAVLGTIRRLKLDQVLGTRRSPESDASGAMSSMANGTTRSSLGTRPSPVHLFRDRP
jgi:hypothetical protein